MKRWLLVVSLLCLLGTTPARAFEVETLRDTGPAEKRFTLAVLGDGYRTEDQTRLKQDAEGIVNYLFGVKPLKQYSEFFNVKLIHVISNDNGGDNGSYGQNRDTALDAAFNCGGIDRLLCVNVGKAETIAANDVPEFNFAVVIVNDTKYGGSGGPICVSSANSDSFEVMAHEIGHSLARLADEYDYEGNQPPCNQQQDCNEANVTLRTDRNQVKWKDWILDATPLPTPKTNQYSAATGLFEGARYQATGIYRPQLNCKMKDLNNDYCSVCTEQFVRSIWSFDNIQMIEQTMPGQNVQVDNCDPIELEATTPPITPSTYRYTWTVDGKMQTEMKSTLQLVPGQLMMGTHDVDLLVEDTTEMVRTDPDNLLRDEYSWSVSVARSDCPVVVGGAAGAGGGGAGGLGGAAGGGAAGGGAAGVGGLTGGAGGVAGASGLAGAGTGGVLRPPPPPQESSGCGCSVPGNASTPGHVALAGLGLAFARRRRAK